MIDKAPIIKPEEIRTFRLTSKHAQGMFWCDTETGGTERETHAVVQVAAIITDMNRNIRSHFSSYIKPSSTNLLVTDEALAVNHLTRDFLEEYGAEEEAVANLLMSFASSFPMLQFSGFNAAFDQGVLYDLLVRHGYTPPWLVPVHDTLRMAKEKLRQICPDQKLTTVADYFGFDISNAHDATVDIFTTIKADRCLLQI